MKGIKLLLLAFVVTTLVMPLNAQTSSNFDFLSDLPDYAHLRNMLPDYLNHMAISRLEQRRFEVARLSSSEDIAKRRAYLREQMLQNLGGLPERTPLNARVVGILDREGYRVEKVIFESQPNFYVTGSLYVPKTGNPSYPGVLFPLGHEQGSKAYVGWQQMLGTLARRGYVAFAWDPIGQGERVQLYDPDLEAGKITESTSEHTVLGIQCLLVGDNLARYTIWDGMRALDYLLARKEVDPARIACTGNSGGGTHTAYLSALDDRIKVAMPSCYITSWRRLLESIGPQDAEQCLPPWIGQGLDHGDFVLAFAPKPYLILSAIRDFFSIAGARETYQEAQHVYSILGAPDKVSQFEADNGHGYLEPRRLAAYRWLSRWLKGQADDTPEVPVSPASEEELRCTQSGQVTVSLGGETVFSLNQKRYAQAQPARTALTSPQAVATLKNEIRSKVQQLTAYNSLAGPLNVKSFGQIRKEGYRIEKSTYESEPGITIPSLLFIPENGENRKPAVLYVNAHGKAAESNSGGEIEQLVKGGFVVLAIDARGWSETGPGENADESRAWNALFPNYSNAMTALLLGKTLVGMRAGDVARGVDLLAGRPEVDAEKIYAFGVDAGAIALLHEAILDARVKKLVLQGMLVSYESVVTHKIHRAIFDSVIPGVLKAYDLPSLVAAAAPRPTWIVNARDPMGYRLGIEKMREQYARPLEAFKSLGAAEALHIAVTEPEEKFDLTYRGLK
jgi:cephalosporin-C deacetylase-like acetyl esterase